MNWPELLQSVAVQAVLLTVLAFLARSIMRFWLDKDLEVFKANLSSGAQRSLEEFKAQLAREAAEHQVRFERSHARRVEAIQAVYVRLVAARYTLESFVSAWRSKDTGEFQKVSQEFWELRRELDIQRIHIPEALVEEVKACIKTMWSPAVAAKVWPDVTNPAYAQKASEAFEQAQAAVLEGGAVDAALANLEREFRKELAAG